MYSVLDFAMDSKVLLVEDLPEQCLKYESVAIDTETMGLCVHRDRLCLVQLCFGDEKCYLIPIVKDKEYNNLKRLLSDERIQKIFHFARFDVAVLGRFFKIDIKNIFCTKIASKLSRTYTSKHGLKDLCHELLGVTLEKEEQTSYWGKDKLSESQLQYAANDVIYLHKIRDILIARLVVENKLNLAEDCFDALLKIVTLDMDHYDFMEIFNH